MATKCSGQNYLPTPLSGNFAVLTLPPWHVFSTASIYQSKKPRWRPYTLIWWPLLLSYPLLSPYPAPSSVPHLSPQRKWRTVQSMWGLDLWKRMGILFFNNVRLKAVNHFNTFPLFQDISPLGLRYFQFFIKISGHLAQLDSLWHYQIVKRWFIIEPHSFFWCSCNSFVPTSINQPIRSRKERNVWSKGTYQRFVSLSRCCKLASSTHVGIDPRWYKPQ